MRLSSASKFPLLLGILIAGAAMTGLVAVAVNLVHRRAEESYRAELEQVRRAMARGAYAAARRSLAQLTSRWPDRGESLFLLGQCEELSGRVGAARTAWERIAPGDPHFVDAVESLSLLLMNAGQLAPAEAALIHGLDNAPAEKRYPILRALARLLRLQGRFDEVSEVLIAGWSSAPEPSEPLQELWQNDTEPVPAEAWKLLLDRADAQDDRVWLGQARLALKTGRFDDSRSWLTRCSERRPNDLAVRRAWLDLSRESLDPERFWAEAERIPASSLQPRDIAMLRWWLAEQSGDKVAEKKELSRLLEIQPTNTRALERLAVLAIESKNPAEAKDVQRAKAELDRAQDVIHKFVVRKLEFRSKAEEIARQSAILGRGFDARAWSLVAAECAGSATTHETRTGESSGSMPRLEEVRNVCRSESEDALARFRHNLKMGAVESTPLAERLSDLRKESLPRGNANLASTSARGNSGSRLHFTDDAASAGLNFVFDNGRTPMYLLPETLSGGVGLIDFDNDGWLDVYCVQGGPFAIDPRAADDTARLAGPGSGDRLFRNQRDGTFQDVTRVSGVEELTRRFGYGMGIAVGDYDNDGHRDLFLTRLHRYALLRNRGDGTFEDATAAAGLDGSRENPTSAAFADLDGDGDLDLYVCHYIRWDPANPQTCRSETGEGLYYCDPAKYEPAADHVLRNDKGRFIDVTREAGFTDPDGRGLGVVAADLDGDRRIDLFVSNDGTANFLFHNRGGFRFEEIGHTSGAAGNAEGGFRAGMGVLAADLDGDERLDLLVTNLYGEGSTLYRNLGGMLFADQSAVSKILQQTRYWTGFGVVDLDAANDGRLHVATANGHVNDFRPFYPYEMPGRLYEVTGGGRFLDVSAQAGSDWDRPRLGRGLARGDLDNDGRMDLLVVGQNEPLCYLHNRTERAGHFLTLRLEGSASNRDGVGATVNVTAGGRRHVLHSVGGGSYLSAGDPRMHCGLGDAAAAEEIDVRWPSGRIDRWQNLRADRAYRLREGTAVAAALPGFSP